MSDTDKQPRGSLRDRLRNEAIRAEEKARDEAIAESESRDFYRRELQPRMLAAREYFEAIAQDLQTIHTPIKAYYDLAHDDVPLMQSDYTIFVDDQAEPHELTLICHCELHRPVARTLWTLREADDFEQRLRDMGLVYHRRREDTSARNEEASSFTIEGGLRAGFSLRANPGDRSAQIETRNLEETPTRRYRLQPQRLSEELFEELGMLLLREKHSILRTELPVDTRRLLRAEAEKRRDEREHLQSQTDDDGEEQHIAERAARAMKNKALSGRRRLLDLLGKQR